MNSMFEKKISELDSNAKQELDGAIRQNNLRGVDYWTGYRAAVYSISRLVRP